MLVIVPSRGRPQNIERLMKAWQDTHTEATMIVGVDEDDPTLDDYLTLGSCEIGPRQGMVGTLNTLAARHANDYDNLGFLGDDNLPRTVGWDTRIDEALTAAGTGVAYGNDLIHGERLPTAAFLTANIIRALGWFTLPTLRHLYVDNCWQALGEALGSLTYLPDVIIEHLHPIAHKAEWDEGYVRVNAPDYYAHDAAAFERWIATGLNADVATVLAGAA